jgi:hypothetical protein
MRQTNYRDLAEFGLTLVTPNDRAFPSLVHDIESRPQPFGSWPTGDLTSAAVLLNQSGKAIIVFAYVWRYTTVEGITRTSRYSNLGSSTQLEVLNGRAEVVRDLGSFILRGSKRLITEQGMFGNNLDVLPRDEIARGGGYVGAGGGGRLSKGRSDEHIVGIELCLDLAIFEDGLCAGPDESGLFEGLTETLERQRSTAQEIVTALRNGASEGQIFELVRPLARHISEPAPVRRHPHPLPLLRMFANMAIHQLVNASTSDLLAWFERSAQSPSLRLRRPS